MKPGTKVNSNGYAVVRLSRNEIVRRIEEGARERCGVSARALLRKYRMGKIDRGGIADLLALSNLLRKNDPIFGE
jgi:hypothetical protein